MKSQRPYAHPLLWVPTSYFTMAIVYMTLTNVVAVMFKNLGMGNAEAAAYASSFGLIYSIKPLFAPFIEMFKTKKFFVVLTQPLLALGFLAVGLALELPNYVFVVVSIFWVMSLLGSAQDISSDGVYVTTLTSEDQSKFCGVQSMSWSVGPIIATGVLVSLAGFLHDKTGDYFSAWKYVFFIFAGITALMSVYHWKVLPPGSASEHTPANARQAANTLWQSLTTFFSKDGIWLMVAFAFLYRISQGFLDKVGQFFILDDVSAGGLGLSNVVLGQINGIYGFIAFLIGSLLGGWFVARRGLKPSLFLLCCAINIPNITYLLLSIYRPESLYLIGATISVEKFFFGFGAVGHMIYMMQQLAPGPFKTAHYAFGTGLMGLCMMVTGLFSGYLQEWMGYQEFFIFVMIVTIPSFVVCWFAPFNVKEEEIDKEAVEGAVLGHETGGKPSTY